MTIVFIIRDLKGKTVQKKPNIEALKAALAASSQGEWKSGTSQAVNVRGKTFVEFGDFASWQIIDVPADAHFIALAHNEMADLLAYVEHLERVIEYDGQMPPTDADYEAFSSNIHDEGDDEMYPGEFSHR